MLLHAFTSACLHVCMPCIHVCMPARLHACTSVATARSALGWYRDQCTVGFCIDTGWGAALGRWLHCFAFLFCEFRRGRGRGRRDGRQRQTNSKHRGRQRTVPCRVRTVPLTLHNDLTDSWRSESKTIRASLDRTAPPPLFFSRTRAHACKLGTSVALGHAPIATTI